MHSANAEWRRRRLPALLAAAAMAALLLARASTGGVAGQELPPTQVEALVVEVSARCRVRFNATGFPEAVVFQDPRKAQVFSDRPARLAATIRPCQAAAAATAGEDPPNVAVTGWRKKEKGGWRRAYAVVTATALTFDAAAGELRFDVVQYPGQAGATKGFGRAGGARKEALRFCAGFVDPFVLGAGNSNNKNVFDQCFGTNSLADVADGSSCEIQSILASPVCV